MRSVKISKLFILVALATGFNSVHAHESYKHALEADQQRLIMLAYARSPWIAREGIRVSVHEGKASLRGKVGHPVASDLATQIALGIDGIKDVDNRIVVEIGFRPPVQPDDKRVSELSVAAKSTVQLESAPIEPINIPAIKATTAWSVADTWITAKVKSSLIYSANVNSSNIEVSTSAGIVTLNGSVSGGAEHALAIERANNVDGVRGVDASEFFNSSAELHRVAQVGY
ncbi:MAG: hypothetical protein VR73_01505 [Gammaproteobacteria bacterium BRH_c0]|nr:MAG: hypothetical protein VR73_01505 [Gammaproteobacteria bacterium BRH_c0]